MGVKTRHCLKIISNLSFFFLYYIFSLKCVGRRTGSQTQILFQICPALVYCSGEFQVRVPVIVLGELEGLGKGREQTDRPQHAAMLRKASHIIKDYFFLTYIAKYPDQDHCLPKLGLDRISGLFYIWHRNNNGRISCQISIRYNPFYFILFFNTRLPVSCKVVLYDINYSLCVNKFFQNLMPNS